MPAAGKGIRGWLSASYGQLVALGQALAGTLKTAPQANAPRVTGSGQLGALGNSVILGVDGMSAAVVQLAGTWAGTVSWTGSVDGGTTWFPISMVPLMGGAGSCGLLAVRWLAADWAFLET